MKLSACVWLVLSLAIPTVSSAGSVFLCRVYSGGSIWSSARCDPNKSVVEREIYVPDSLSWEERVKFGEQRLAESRAMQQGAVQAPSSTTTTNTVTTVTTTSQQSLAVRCQALNAEIANYDAMARQTQSGQMQDWIAEQKRNARTKQFGLHCQ